MRRGIYKKVREDLWDKYCRLRKEVKELVRQRKLTMWKEVVEKGNIMLRGVRKDFGLLLVGEQRLRTEVLFP